ncbi:hypothetical protein [Anaerocellum danielii]|uniref:Uncharacterized protein n=1 Tax=Anaerocellum danielii TaxID=1387557 RepID=A0ABZ0TWG8_9FIRM|nr:hypothetical protein [Caldicellulosiruptor danielii]WPX07794.1 hypothetical protein SOJ16_001623 [Caldicellulosiruptor danielii]
MSKDYNDSFIVTFWERIFYYLSKISIFYWVRKIAKNKGYFLVDAWVLGNILLSFLAVVSTYYINSRFKAIFWIILIYGVLRVFEIIVYQVNVLFFDRIRTKKNKREYKIKSVTRTIILLLHNFVEIMLWYSVMMICLLKIGGNFPDDSSVWDFIRANILNVTIFNADEIEQIAGSKNSTIANLIFFENITGLFMTLLCLARFINLLPPVESEEEM